VGHLGDLELEFICLRIQNKWQVFFSKVIEKYRSSDLGCCVSVRNFPDILKMVVLLYSRDKISQESSSLEGEKNMFILNFANTKPRGVTCQRTGPLKYCAMTT
jgi:hypothetical protein